MLKGIVGLQNAGKTLRMTLDLYKDHLNGRKIYTNYYVSFPHTLINKETILSMAQDPNTDLYNCSIAIDEMWIFFDSRRAMSDDNMILSWLLLQSSKTDTNIYATAQRFGQLDKRFRDNVHSLIECERVLKTNKGYYRLSAGLERRDLGEIHPVLNEMLRIESKTYRRERKGKFEDFVLKKTEYINAQPIFKYFNSFEKKHIHKD